MKRLVPVLTAIPLAIGWLAGAVVKILALWKAALIEGFHTGSKP